MILYCYYWRTTKKTALWQKPIGKVLIFRKSKNPSGEAIIYDNLSFLGIFEGTLLRVISQMFITEKPLVKIHCGRNQVEKWWIWYMCTFDSYQEMFEMFTPWLSYQWKPTRKTVTEAENLWFHQCRCWTVLLECVKYVKRKSSIIG